MAIRATLENGEFGFENSLISFLNLSFLYTGEIARSVIESKARLSLRRLCGLGATIC
jgi:hypothetical protein